MERSHRMRKAAFALFLIALALPVAAFAVTFGSTPVAVGNSWTQTSSYGSSMELTVDNGMGTGKPYSAQIPPGLASQQTSITVTKSLKVTAMQGPKISGVEVDYDHVEIDGIDRTSLVSGHRYAIALNGGHVSSVTYANGGTPTAEEEAFVRLDNASVGQIREMNRTFAGETVAIGQPLSAKDPEDLFDVQEGFEVDSFSMTLASTAGDGADETATFDVVLAISSSVKKRKGSPVGDPAPFTQSRTSMRLAGTLTANVSTGRVIGFDLTGPATASGRKEARGRGGEQGKSGVNGVGARVMSVSGTGTGFMESSFAYD